MASCSATCLSLNASPYQTNKTSQVIGSSLKVNLVSFGLANRSFRSIRAPLSRVSCAATAETVQKVVEIVRKQLAIPAETALTPESKFTELGADSLDTVEIVMELEEAFDISVEEESSQNITSVQEAADLIDKLISKKAEA